MTKTIEDILKDMPLDAAVKTGLKESWEAALADAKVAQEAQVKEELSARFDADMTKIQEAFGTYLEERIKPHVADLSESVAEVEKIKVDYAAKTVRIKEAAQKYVNNRFAAIEQVMEERIRAELSELHEDVVANRRAALQAINEKRNELEADRQKFKAKAAGVLENIINVKLPKELDDLREDIEAAKKDNFGRAIFEEFSTMFRRQFFDTSAEFQALVADNKALKEAADKTKTAAARAIKESKDDAAAAKKAYGQLRESAVRQKAMARLLKPLSGAPRAQMKTLLEATNTDKLDATFRKALPQLVREAKAAKAPAKKSINEGKRRKTNVAQMELRTGSQQKLNESDYDEFETEVADIRRLAGNKA